MASPSSRAATGEESQSNSSTADATAGTLAAPADATENAGALPKDVLFELLSVRRRRAVLRYLNEVERATTLSDLCEHIAANENGTDVSHLSAAQRKRVYVALYQCHLPKMDDANVIDFEKERGTIEVRAEAAQLFPYLYLDSGTALTPTSRAASVGSSLLHAFTAIFKGRILG